MYKKSQLYINRKIIHLDKCSERVLPCDHLKIMGTVY